jgi:23S rRNA (uracil1939-C5)-methyltransferase
MQVACPHFPRCVGCALTGKAYGEQLRIKRTSVVDAFASYRQLADICVPEVIGSPRLFGYRNQAKLVARRARGRLLLGVYRPGTHQVVDISACVVHQPMITAVVARVRQALTAAQVPAYDERTGAGWLRYLLVRTSAWQREAHVTLVVRDRSWDGERALLQQLHRLRGVSGVSLNLNPTPGNAILGDRFIAAGGQRTLIERIGGLKLQNSPGAFLQANVAAVRRVYDRAAAWAAPTGDALAVDLYAGVGAISFRLADLAQRVIGIEESPIAVRDAQANCRINGYHNVRFLAARAAAGLAEVTAASAAVEIIALNPPRKGADLDARRAIADAAPRRIVYLSCGPASLARDLGWFVDAGYRVAAVQPYDLLPQTEHVETLVLLVRG